MPILFAQDDESLPIKDTPIPTSSDSHLSPLIERFLERAPNATSSKSAEPTIKVSDVLSSIAAVYEKIRNTIEYKGEQVLRRNAIERILKRLFWEKPGADTNSIAASLLRELIWARYVKNDSLPKSKIKDIAQLLNKYLFLLSSISQAHPRLPTSKIRAWIMGVASCEIEESIDATRKEAYVILMYEWFNEYFVWTSDQISTHEKDTQLYLAIHRALTKSDDEIMRYHLLFKEFSGFATATHDELVKFAEHFPELVQEIDRHLTFSRRFILYRIVQKHTAPFEVLRELGKLPDFELKTILLDQNKLTEMVKTICQTKYAQIQKKVNRGTVRSIIYIFVTKVVFAMLIEIPYELYRLGGLTLLPLSINIAVPPLMMWFIGLSIKAPGANNTERIIEKLKTVVYKNELSAKISFSLTVIKRGSFLIQVFTLLYLLLFMLVFGGITYFLLKLHYSILGLAVFFAFLSLVLLFGYRVKFTASELKVTSDREGLFEYLLNNLTLPFLSAGVYLSKGLAKINFFSVILDFMIEAPFKTIIEVLEEWTSFIREKREEVVEVPQD